MDWPTTGYINTPPGTAREYEIAKGMLLIAGITTRDPAKGVLLKPRRPENYSFETKGPGIKAGLAICIVVMTLVTATRLYLRFFARGLQWGVDDILIIPGLVMAVAYPALQIAMVNYGGAGKHIFDVSYEEYYNYKWLANIAQINYFVCVGVIKLSITAFNIRLTSMSSRKWKIATWSFFSLCLLYTVAAIFINVFQCSPPGSSFDLLLVARSGVPPRCIGVSHMNTILRICNIILDYCLLTVPIIIISKVSMSLKRKIKLIILFSVGGLACIGSVMTLVSKFRLKEDALWNYTGILGWSLVELVLGVLAASLPILASLLPPKMQTTGQFYFTQNKERSPRAQEWSSTIPHSRGEDGEEWSSVGADNHGVERNRKGDAESDTVGIIQETEIELDRRWSKELGNLEKLKEGNAIRDSESNDRMGYAFEPSETKK